MAFSITLLGSSNRDFYGTLRDRGYRVTEAAIDDLSTLHPTGSKGPDAFVVDIRPYNEIPRELATVMRHFPNTGIVIVAQGFDATGMRAAMRMGITEWVAEPLDLAELDASLRKVTRPAGNQSVNGQAFAIVGGKGGVGTTTIAVNLAAAIRRATSEPTLLVDLHMAQGDTSVYLGVEPRFTVLDALENIHRLDEIYFKGLVTATPAGIDLLAAANRPALGSIDVLRVRALVEFVTTAYKWAVIDCPHSDAAVIDALDVASSAIIVANQELATLRSGSRLAAALRQRCGTHRVKLALSRFDGEAEIGRKDVERVLGGGINYMFPSDYRSAVSALNRGEPIVLGPASRLATAFEDTARELAGLQEKPKDMSRTTGLFARLGGRR